MDMKIINDSNVVEDNLFLDWDKEHLTGTSIMAVEFDGGVVIGADSRTTSGAYIMNRISNKLTKITDYIYCCRSGSSADTQAIAEIATYHLNFHEIELGEPISVKAAANVFRDMCYKYRDMIMAGIIIAGWDIQNGGQVYSIPLGGMCVRQPIATGGSGSTYIYGYVDANFKPNMEQKMCQDLVIKALALAMARDGSSGGVINLATITKDGVQKQTILPENLPYS